MDSTPSPAQGEPGDNKGDESAEFVTSISGSQLRDSDVLFGRGTSVLFHPGNVRFRRLVEENRTGYMAATRAMKTDFTEKLVKNVICIEGCRFLKRKSPNHKWTEVNGAEVVEKVKQALREKRKPEPSHYGLFRKRKVIDHNSSNNNCSELDSASALSFNSSMIGEQSQRDSSTVSTDRFHQLQNHNHSTRAMSANVHTGGLPLSTAPFSAEYNTMFSLYLATMESPENPNNTRCGPEAPLDYHHSLKPSLAEEEQQQRIHWGQNSRQAITNFPPDQRKSPVADDSRDSVDPTQESSMMSTFPYRLPVTTALKGSSTSAPSLQALLSTMTPVSLGLSAERFHGDCAQLNRRELVGCFSATGPPLLPHCSKNGGGGGSSNSTSDHVVKSLLSATDPASILPYAAPLHGDGAQVNRTKVAFPSSTNDHSAPSIHIPSQCSAQPNTLWSAAKRRKNKTVGDAVMRRQQEVYERALRETASDGQE